MMKKVFALVLTILIVLACLASCGSAEESKKKSGKKDFEEIEETEKAEDSEIAEAPEETLAPEVTEAPKETEAPEEEEEVEDEEYVYGTLSGNSWKSEWMGIAFEAKGDYRMYTTEEILTLNGLTEVPESNDYGDLYAVYEMLAVDNTNGNNVLVMTEKLYGANVDISMDDYIEALESVFATTIGEGVNVDLDDSCTVAGLVWTKINVSYELNGLQMAQAMLLKKKGDRIIAVTITDMTGTAFDDIEKMFSAA